MLPVGTVASRSQGVWNFEAVRAARFVQLVVNVVAVATAAGGALFLRESPLTAVQMVRALLCS